MTFAVIAIGTFFEVKGLFAAWWHFLILVAFLKIKIKALFRVRFFDDPDANFWSRLFEVWLLIVKIKVPFLLSQARFFLV